MFKKTISTLLIFEFLIFTTTSIKLQIDPDQTNDDIINSYSALLESEKREVYKSYLTAYGKSYSNDNIEKLHFIEFNKNMLKIADHNNKPGISYRLGINQFTDLTEEEMNNHMGLIRFNEKN